MTAARLAGGCQCGAVRYRLSSLPEDVHLCHCRMCQRAVGGPFAAFAPVPKTDITWTEGAPAAFESSPGIRREYCKDCGTPLTFNRDNSERMNVTIGSLDDPNAVSPELNFGTESRVAWLCGINDLPDKETTPEGITG